MFMASVLSLAALLGSLTVTVVGGEGERIPYAAIDVAREGVVERREVSGADGVVKIHGLRPGTYEVSVNLDGFVPQKLVVSVGPGEDAEVDTKLLDDGASLYLLFYGGGLDAKPPVCFGVSALPPNPSLQRTAALRASAAELMIR